jgi:phage terminase Nu1 subunit (DNA packaging protein)
MMELLTLNQQVKRNEFGALVGVSRQVIDDLIKRGILSPDSTAGQWLIAYCANLREQAAGRASTGGLNLAQERAALAKEQRLIAALKRARMEREQAPIALLELALSDVSAQIAAILDALPGKVARTSGQLTATDVDLISAELAKARNIALAIEIDSGKFDELINDSHQDSHSARPKTA